MKVFLKWIFNLFRRYLSPSNSDLTSIENDEIVLNETKDVKEYEIVFTSEFPNRIDCNFVYIECNIEKNDFWYAKLICPCGCQETITLNLIDDVDPCWSLEFEKQSFSIHPSIRRTTNCKSHFWILNNIVIWALD